jgi:hypothetical protein
MMMAAQLAKRKILVLHQSLNAALNELEGKVLLEREQRKETLRLYLQEQQKQQSAKVDNAMDADDAPSQFVSSNEAVGIDRDDPILDWQNLHQPVFTREKAAVAPPKAPPSSKKSKK